jgi:radical SAM protein with 4Fe4S-binding SPASM domain
MSGEKIEDIRTFWEDKVDNLEIWKPHGWAGKRAYRGTPNKVIKKPKSCNRPFCGPVQIQSDGTVIPCCFLTDSELVLGNTYKNSLKEILNDYPYQWLKQMHSEGGECYPCLNCDQYYESNESPLLYSSVDPECKAGKTSSIKFEMIAN